LLSHRFFIAIDPHQANFGNVFCINVGRAVLLLAMRMDCSVNFPALPKPGVVIVVARNLAQAPANCHYLAIVLIDGVAYYNGEASRLYIQIHIAIPASFFGIFPELLA
jgi:hypothetical protein